MVNLEFEKPSTWSIGKKLGLLAIILLVVGPFMPYFVSEVSLGNGSIQDSITYFDYDIWGLFIFLPLFSAILMVIFLYIKFDLFFEMGTSRVKVDHFILMIWGFWFFLTYTAEAFRLQRDSSYYSQYAGYGLWMIVAGFFLMALIGFFEWRYPSTAGPAVPKVGLPKRKEKEAVAEVTVNQVPEGVAEVEPEKIPVVPTVKSGPPMVEPKVDPKPAPVTPSATPQKVEPVVSESTSEEEKTLMRWARHINRDNQTFEQCIKCNNYTFISAKDTGDSILFKCPDCKAAFTLKK